MDARNTSEPIFSAVITPHRSLGRSGFVILMSTIGLISFTAGMIFMHMGAWPIFGFFGLDVLLIYWAFRVNYARADASEQVIVGYDEIRVRRTDHRGGVQEWTVNPLWATLEREEDADFGLMRFSLVVRGRRLTLGRTLAPLERESFAAAFSAALTEAKRGPTHTLFAV